jgi:excisionase family DNA binding protein
MPTFLGGVPYYRVAEVAETVGVHPRTLRRWIKAGKVPDGKRDRNHWRVFSEAQVEQIKDFALSTSHAGGSDEQMFLFRRRRGRANADNRA